MKGVNLGLKVIKRLFAVFLVLGALMSVEAWGADNKQNQTPIDSTIKDTSFVANVYNYLISFTQSISKDLRDNAYKSISSIFNNVISILLATIAFFWLFNHLKNGTISREEVFKALIFVIVFVIVYVLLNSYPAFKGFLSIFSIPQDIVKAALTGALGSGNIGDKLNYALTKPFFLIFDITPEIFWHYWEQYNGIKALLALGIAPTVTVGMAIFYSIYLLMLFIIIIAITIIHMYAIFLQSIYESFLPIIIPLLLIPQTKSIFFAWVKSFVGITMYVPLSMIPLSIINKISVMIGTSSLDYIVPKLFFFTLLGMISCIIAILLLQKIPTWISELLGVANQGVGMGGALGMLKTAGMGVGSAMMGYGGGLVKNLSSSFGKGASSGIKSSLANLATGGLYGGAAESAKSLGSLMKNGFKSTANYFKGKEFKPDTNK